MADLSEMAQQSPSPVRSGPAVPDRVERITARDRMDRLVEAMKAINSIVDLDDTLGAIVRTATGLVDATYTVFRVYGHTSTLDRYVYQDSDAVIREQTGAPPEGLGALGALPDRPNPARLDNDAEHPAALGSVTNHPPMRSFLTVPVHIRDEMFGHLYLTEKSGGLPFTEDDEVIVRALAAAAGIAIDNSRLYESARTRQAWTAATRDIAAEFLAGAPTAEVLAQLTDHARTLSGSQWAALAAPPDPDTPPAEIDELVITQSSGAAAGFATGRALSVQDTATGRAFLQRTVVSLADAARCELGDLFPGAGPALIVPLHTPDATLGVLVVMRPAEQAPYTADIAELATAFTDQTAVAVQLADARQRMRVLDILADRDRIAHELHDHVIQQLFAIGLTLQGIIPRTHIPLVQARLSGVVDDLQDVVQEIRTVIFELHGGDRRSIRLRERIDRAIRCEAARGGIRNVLRINGPLSVVGADLADQVEAVVCEAIRNAVRHSGAASVEIEIGVADDLTVIVTDDGRRIADHVTSGELSDLRRHAQGSGGRFEVRPLAPPQTGTRLYWSVPLR